MPKQTDSASKKAIKSQQLSIVHLVYCRNINKNVHKECIFVSGISSYTPLCQIQIRRDSFFPPDDNDDGIWFFDVYLFGSSCFGDG